MKTILLLSLIFFTFSKVIFVNEIKPEGCTDCYFKSTKNSRTSEIHDGVIVIPGEEKVQNSHKGLSTVLFVYQKENGKYKFHKKLTMPTEEGKFVNGQLYTSLSKGKLIAGLLPDIPGGYTTKQKVVVFSKSKDWNPEMIPTFWAEGKPPVGSLRSNVRIIAISGDYAIVGCDKLDEFHRWEYKPLGYYLSNGKWERRWESKSHFSQFPIATGYNGPKDPSFLVTVVSKSYVLFDPVGAKNKTDSIRFKESRYYIDTMESFSWSAMDKTSEVVLHRFRNSILVWYKPRNGRSSSSKPDTVIQGNNGSFGQYFAAYNDKQIVATSGDGKIFVYERNENNFKVTQEISLPGVSFESLSQVVDDDGTFVGIANRNGVLSSFIFKFE
eukprot:gene11811-5142_t